MPTTYDYEFIDGFDKYGPPGMRYPSFQNLMIQGEWTSLPDTSFGGGLNLVQPPDNSTGCALAYSAKGDFGTWTYKTLPNRYARCIGGVSQTYNFGCGTWGGIITLFDTGTPTFHIAMNNVGQIVVAIGSHYNQGFIVSNAIVYTSLESVGVSSSHYFEWDVNIHPTTGWVKVWLDGVLTSINYTNVNTSGTGAVGYNGMGLGSDNAIVPFGPGVVTWDHLYTWHYLSTVGTDTPLLTNPVIETQFPNSDSVVHFVPEQTVLGEAFSYSGTYDTVNAGTVVLMKFTPVVDMTINDVSFLSNTTSGTAKFKSVVYSDDGNPLPSYSLPLNKLSDGTEKVGINAGVIQRCPLAAGVALTAGTPYWIGFYSDTNIGLLRFNDIEFTGVAKTLSGGYVGAAPATMSALATGWRPYMIYGNCNSETTNYTQVTDTLLNPPLGDLSYNDSDTVGDEDLFGYPNLNPRTANVYTVAVKAYMRRTEAGYRLMDIRTKSGATDSVGSTPAQAPPASFGWITSYFDVDPNTSSPWTPSAVNVAVSGYKINA